MAASAPPLVIAEPTPPRVVAPEPVLAEPTPPPPEAPQAEPSPEGIPPDAPQAEPVAGRLESPPPPPAEEPAKDGNGEDIARAIAAAKRAAVRTCFEHELKEQPQLRGTVIVELDLAPPNRVDGLRVSDDLNRPTFTRCVTSAMQGVRFAALDEEVSVRVPYVLSPERR
ncbi:MAG: AgmX/PglI C-terminal domain-containing protein [Archangium sp.]|nr:AgmX/PglI C-terminal domain-containing protein [Archangium sp.]